MTATLLVAFYYMSYRYPFEIGDGVLTTTYSETPVWIQVLKYAVLGLLIPIGLFTLRRDRQFTFLEKLIAAFSILGCVYCAGIALIDLPIATSLFEIGFVMFFAVLFANPAKFEMTATKFVKMLKIFFWLNLVVYIVQFALFWFFDRWPGMSYGGATTRFGGIWDDPNSALAPFALYIPYWMVNHGINWRAAGLIAIAIVSIILAQSVTSLVAIVIAIPIMILFFRKQWTQKTQTLVFLGFIGFLAIAIAVGVVTYLSGALDVNAIMAKLDATLVSKAESASLRSESYDLLSETSLMTVVGLDPLLDKGENQFVNIFANFGGLILVMFVAIHLVILRCLYDWTRLASGKKMYALAVACSCYFIWYFVSMMNIPKAEVFPVNLLAAIVAGMAIAARKGLIVNRSLSPARQKVRQPSPIAGLPQPRSARVSYR